jgi:hypothetical protein
MMQVKVILVDDQDRVNIARPCREQGERPEPSEGCPSPPRESARRREAAEATAG